jgi:hypothetical protein
MSKGPWPTEALAEALDAAEARAGRHQCDRRASAQSVHVTDPREPETALPQADGEDDLEPTSLRSLSNRVWYR